MQKVAITIDTEFPDNPAADPLRVFDEVLAILAERGISGTFFVVGSWARAYPDRVRAIVDAGHVVGSHSYSHCDLMKLTGWGIVRDLADCDVMLGAVGVDAHPWFRAPYGAIGADQGPHREMICAAIAEAGYHHVTWDACGDDYMPGRAADEIAEKTLAEVRGRSPEAAIVLFHSWPDPTPAALTRVLDELGASDVEFITVPQLG